jgi:hypothetical protein
MVRFRECFSQVGQTFSCLLIAWALAAPLLHAQSLNGCPPGNERARNVVESYLSGPEWAEKRKRAGISVDTSKIRLLTDEKDPDACRRLTDGVRNTEWIQHVFYKAGPYYFDVTQIRSQSEWPGDRVPGVNPGLMVFNQSFELVGIYMR